jgi:hypothetical protein
MKIFCLILVSFFSFAMSFAQETGAIPSKPIPRVEVKIPAILEEKPQYSISKPFEITKFKKPSKIYDAPKLEPSKSLNQPKSDLNVGKIFEEKLNKKPNPGIENSDSKLYRRNMFLGDFKSKAEKIGIFYRDFGLVDGDLIRVLVNDKIVIYEIYLEGNFQQLDIKLEKGINKIDFEALNQGSSGPNTAEFKIYDEKETLISENQWNLGKGFKATILIVKE